MSKRIENITLFNQPFEYDTKETIGYHPIGNDTVFDVYGRCSDTKKAIWRFWENWFLENNGNCCVASHNSNFFTIEGYVRNYETREMYYCYITASHNRCWKVD